MRKKNQDAISAPLAQQLAEEEKRRKRRAAVDALMELRREQSPVSAEEIAAARRAGRP